MGMPEVSYDERRYECPPCGFAGSGYEVLQKSPAEFLIQPHRMYPMTLAEFDRWAAILKAHFPGHGLLAELGSTFVPCTPPEAHQYSRAHDVLYAVRLMRDQDGASRNRPQLSDAEEWLDMMGPNDTLTFEDRRERRLVVRCVATKAFSVDGPEETAARSLSHPRTLDVIREFFHGHSKRRPWFG